MMTIHSARNRQSCKFFFDVQLLRGANAQRLPANFELRDRLRIDYP